jgi:hypothetical protein
MRAMGKCTAAAWAVAVESMGGQIAGRTSTESTRQRRQCDTAGRCGITPQEGETSPNALH